MNVAGLARHLPARDWPPLRRSLLLADKAPLLFRTLVSCSTAALHWIDSIWRCTGPPLGLPQWWIGVVARTGSLKAFGL